MKSTITLQFSTSTAWQSAIIRTLCHSPFSHIDILLSSGNLLGASDSPDAPVIKGNPRGVAVRPPDYQEFGLRCNAIIQTPWADTIINKAMSQLDKPFDHGALYNFLIDPLLPEDKLWVAQWIGSPLLAGLVDRLVDREIEAHKLKAFVAGDSVKGWRDTGQWFCAEHVAWALEEGGYWQDSIGGPRKLDWPLARISPTDLLFTLAMDENFVNRDEFWNKLGSSFN